MYQNVCKTKTKIFTLYFTIELFFYALYFVIIIKPVQTLLISESATAHYQTLACLCLSSPHSKSTHLVVLASPLGNRLSKIESYNIPTTYITKYFLCAWHAFIKRERIARKLGHPRRQKGLRRSYHFPTNKSNHTQPWPSEHCYDSRVLGARGFNLFLLCHTTTSCFSVFPFLMPTIVLTGLCFSHLLPNHTSILPVLYADNWKQPPH